MASVEGWGRVGPACRIMWGEGGGEQGVGHTCPRLPNPQTRMGMLPASVLGLAVGRIVQSKQHFTAKSLAHRGTLANLFLTLSSRGLPLECPLSS